MLKVNTSPVYLLLYVLSGLLCAIEHSLAQASPAVGSGHDSKPNVLLLLADDMGYNDSAIYQQLTHLEPVAHLPAIEALASQGIRYSRFYTESTCSASRAALLTGQYAARNGFIPVARGLSPDLETLPKFLKHEGYRTHLVGKWHVGEIQHDALPMQQGFDTFYGFLSQWMLRGPDADGHVQLKNPTYQNPWLLDEGATVASSKIHEGHLEDLLTARTVSLIQQAPQDQQPWFIYHAFFAPHTPLEPAERFAKRFPATKEGRYRAMLAQLDDSVLQILSALKTSGQWDNTIIIFASDNGSPEKIGSPEKTGSPEKSLNSNAPFLGKKAEYEEGGIRTPLVIKWNQAINRSEVRSNVVSIMDIYPSLAAVIAPGHKTQNLDGFATLLPGQPEQRQSPLFFLTYGSMSVLSANGLSRILQSWDAETLTDSMVLHYDAGAFPADVSASLVNRILHQTSGERDSLFAAFLAWRNEWRAVKTEFHGQQVSGKDFLRAPINPSWAMAFAFQANNNSKRQQLIYQPGLVDVHLEDGKLDITVNGVKAGYAGVKSGQCYRVVLSGEFYDRYSAVRNGTLPSRLHVVIDGVETSKSEAVLDDFEQLDTRAPSWVGKHPEKPELAFDGKISEPAYFATQLLPIDQPVASAFQEATQGLCHF